MLKARVVEDEEDIKQLLRDELEDKGCQVIEACNGEIDLEQASRDTEYHLCRRLYAHHERFGIH